MEETLSLNEMITNIKTIFPGKVRAVVWHRNTVTGWLAEPWQVFHRIDTWDLCKAFCDRTNSRNELIRVNQLQVFGTTQDDSGNIVARKQVYNLCVCNSMDKAVLVEDYENVDKDPPKWIGFS